MYPTLMQIDTPLGVFSANTYGLCIVLAFSAAFGLVHIFSERVGFHPDRLPGVYVASAVGGLLGGRLLYAIAVEPARTLSDPLSIGSCSGFAFYGGVVGGALGVFAVSRVMALHPWKLADVAAPAVVIGHAVGRFGCFFAGCCHGAAAPFDPAAAPLLPEGLLGGQLWLQGSLPFLTSEFHGGVGRILDTPLYPTQLWTVVANFAIVAMLAALFARRRFDGQVAAVALMIEPPSRIIIEAFRADHRGTVLSIPVPEELAALLPGMAQAGAELGSAPVLGLTTSQALGLGGMVLGAAIYATRFRSGVDEEVSVEASEDDEDPLLADL